jgi:hypothetical protein
VGRTKGLASGKDNRISIGEGQQDWHRGGTTGLALGRVNRIGIGEGQQDWPGEIWDSQRVPHEGYVEWSWQLQVASSKSGRIIERTR